MIEKKYKFETIEEYREYLRKNSKKWYANNKEKKVRIPTQVLLQSKAKEKDEAINI